MVSRAEDTPRQHPLSPAAVGHWVSRGLGSACNRALALSWEPRALLLGWAAVAQPHAILSVGSQALGRLLAAGWRAGLL